MTYNDPSECEYWVGCYLPDAVWWLPIMDANEDFVPRRNYSVPINPPPTTRMVAGMGAKRST